MVVSSVLIRTETIKFLLLFVFATCAFEETIRKSSFRQKILGGTKAREGQFPFQISLRINGKHVCGGSIIDQYTILTAAHCVDKRNSRKMSIMAGTNKLNQRGVLYSISQYIVHPNWNFINSPSDLAVIKIKTPIQYTEYIKPIDIDDSFTTTNDSCISIGWGLTSVPGNISNDLLFVQMRVVDLDQCKEKFPLEAYPKLENNICVYQKKGAGVCWGDSGGPLVRNKKQIGITSWGVPCGVGYPDIYTRTSYYFDWIKAQKGPSK